MTEGTGLNNFHGNEICKYLPNIIDKLLVLHQKLNLQMYLQFNSLLNDPAHRHQKLHTGLAF